jgi:hypothetical protein
MEIIDWSKLEGYAHAAKLAEIALGKARVEIAENERLLAEIKAKMRELLVPEVKPVPLATVPVLLKVRTCRVCGCTEAKACLTAVGCGWWWIDDPEGGDLCSECDPTLQAALAAETAIQCETTVVHSDGAQLMEEQGEWVAMDAAFDMPMRMPAVSITIDPPVGSEVDQWAENFGFKRGEGESDVELRVRVRDKILNAPRARCNYLDCQNLQEPRMNYCAEHLQPRVPTSEQAPAAPEVSSPVVAAPPAAPATASPPAPKVKEHPWTCSKCQVVTMRSTPQWPGPATNFYKCTACSETAGERKNNCGDEDECAPAPAAGRPSIRAIVVAEMARQATLGFTEVTAAKLIAACQKQGHSFDTARTSLAPLVHHGVLIRLEHGIFKIGKK